MYVTTTDSNGNTVCPCFCSCRSKEEHERKIAEKKARLFSNKINEGKTMDSAKKSVEKILEIAQKHGYACVVGFKKIGGDDLEYGITGPLEDCNKITQKAFGFIGDKDGE